MADITQITASDSVTFSANSNAADLWMREHYQRRQICFDLFRDLADALAFIEAAIDQGLSIGSLDRHGLHVRRRGDDTGLG
jgi:hypothetical protein